MAAMMTESATLGRAVVVRHRRVMPPVVVHLGSLVGVIYRSDRGRCGSPRNYVHFMKEPPALTSSVDGTRLFIVGGNYRVTPRGIEDLPDPDGQRNRDG
jgi:hypothetical protein